MTITYYLERFSGNFDSDRKVTLNPDEILIFNAKVVSESQYCWGLQNFLLLKAGFSYDASQKLYTIDEKKINNEVDGKKDGPHFDYVDGHNSFISRYCEYKNGLRDGFYAEFWKCGHSLLTKYSKDKLHGYTRRSHCRDVFGKAKHGFSSNGLKEGEWIENGGKGNYKNGLREGEWIDDDGKGYYENGYKEGEWIENEGKGNYKNGLREGEWIILEQTDNWDSNRARYLYDYPSKLLYKNGKEIIQDGKFIVHHESGNLWAEGSHKNGAKDGKWTCFHDNGNIYSEILYKNGEILKEREILYDGADNKKSDITIEKDKRCCIWYSKGKRKRLINYKYDSIKKSYYKNGLFIDYYKGNKILEVNYKNDEKDGKSIYFNELGNTISEIEYLAEQEKRKK